MDEKEYSCSRCATSYLSRLGFPDFRVFPIPHFDYEDDNRVAQFLAEHSDHLDFEGLVRLYWSIKPTVSRGRTERFIRRLSASIEKGTENLKKVRGSRNQLGSSSVLEIGCGAGGFLVAANDMFEHVIGFDIALQWLVIARKRLNDLGLEPPLICGCAEYLPFEDGSFDLVLAEDVLEHVECQEATLRECRRVMDEKGTLFIATPNRFSIAPEPHVGVWGVGWLPRRWMNRYVTLVRGVPYERYKLLSFFELKRLLKKCSLRDHEISIPSIPEAEFQGFATVVQLQVAAYNVVRRIPLIRVLLFIFGPFFHVICHANMDHNTAPTKGALALTGDQH